MNYSPFLLPCLLQVRRLCTSPLSYAFSPILLFSNYLKEYKRGKAVVNLLKNYRLNYCLCSDKLILTFVGFLNKEVANHYIIIKLFFEFKQVVPTYMGILGRDPDTFSHTELDRIFGAQRLTGTNPVVIERVKDLFKLKETWVYENK